MSERIQNVHPKEYKGVQYKSTLEAETAETLDKLGLPINYEARKIVLLEGFRCPYQKNKVKSVHYTPDFWIGNILIECKGFETPEWKIKKKLIFKYLMDYEPQVIYKQIHNSKKELLEALDPYWATIGYAIRVTSKRDKKNGGCISRLYGSVAEALVDLGLKGKSFGLIMRSLTKKTDYIFGYKWEVEKLKI